MTYEIDKLCELKSKYLEFQRKIDFCNWKRKSFYEINGCCLCCEGCEGVGCFKCISCQSKEGLSLIINKQSELKVEMDELLSDFKKKKNLSIYYNRSAFVTFKTEYEARYFLKQYPASIFGYSWAIVRYLLTNILCCWLFSERTKNNNRKRILYSVSQAYEPEDIIWQNLEYSPINRLLRKFGVYLSTLVFLGISLAIMYGINAAQVQ